MHTLCISPYCLSKHFKLWSGHIELIHSQSTFKGIVTSVCTLVTSFTWFHKGRDSENFGCLRMKQPVDRRENKPRFGHWTQPTINYQGTCLQENTANALKYEEETNNICLIIPLSPSPPLTKQEEIHGLGTCKT